MLLDPQCVIPEGLVEGEVLLILTELRVGQDHDQASMAFQGNWSCILGFASRRLLALTVTSTLNRPEEDSSLHVKLWSILAAAAI